MTPSNRWGAQYHRERAKELEEERVKLMKELGPGDPMRDIRYVKLRLSQETNYSMMRHDDIGAEATRLRTDRHRALGKQYGIASRTIQKLRGEVAVLRAELQRERANRFYVAQDIEFGIHYEYSEEAAYGRGPTDAGPFPEESVDQVVTRNFQRSTDSRAQSMGIKATKIFRTITRGPWQDHPTTPIEDCTHGSALVPITKKESTES